MNATKQSMREMADMSMVWDAAMLILAQCTVLGEADCADGLDGLAIASEDDEMLFIFGRVKAYSAMRRHSLCTYWVKRDRPPIGIRKDLRETAESFGAEVVPYGTEVVNRSMAWVTMHGYQATLSHMSRASIIGEIDQGLVSDASAQLAQLGFEAAGRQDVVSNAAAAKFFLVNHLGPVVLYPRDHKLQTVVDVLVSGCSRVWVPNPGNLVYIEPVGSESPGEAAFGIASGGGPFILNASEDIVQRVLLKMGYLEEWEPEHYESALSWFWEINQRFRLEQKVPALDDFRARERALHDAFLGQQGRQQWHVPIRDVCARLFLSERGLVCPGLACCVSPSGQGASRAHVLRVAAGLLDRAGLLRDLKPSYYHGVMGRLVLHLPMLRER
eukprot:UN0369